MGTKGIILSTLMSAATVLCVSALLLLPHPSFDPDFGWHLRVGDWIIRNWAVPRTDIISFSQASTPWVAHSWLQEVLYSLAWSAFGSWGVRIWFYMLGALFSAIILLGFLPRGSCSSLRNILAFFLVAVLVADHYWGTQMVSLVFFSCCLLVINKAQSSSRGRIIYTLVPVFWLWANMHGGFVLGWAYLFGVLCLEILRHLLHRCCPVSNSPAICFIKRGQIMDADALINLSLSLILCVLVTSANPYGIELFAEITQTIGSTAAKQYVKEWRPPVGTELPGGLLILATVAAAVYFYARRNSVSAQEVIFALFFLALALSARRHVVFFVVYILNLSLPSLGAIKPIHERVLALIERSLLAGALIFLGCYVLLAWSGPFAPYERMKSRYPIEGFERMKDLLPTARMFHELEWGGILPFIEPRARTFIDGRMVFWGDGPTSPLGEYLITKRALPGWQKIIEKYEIDLIAISPSSGLGQALSKGVEPWHLVYKDKVVVIFSKQTPDRPLG